MIRASFDVATLGERERALYSTRSDRNSGGKHTYTLRQKGKQMRKKGKRRQKKNNRTKTHKEHDDEDNESRIPSR